MLLSRLVETSRAVSETRARSKKIALLSALLRELDPGEVALAVAYLSGELPEGRIGLGYAAAYGSSAEPAREASLDLRELDARLSEIRAERGTGSGKRRTELLGALLARATAGEQEFVKRLIVGELRQGALEGVMAEAIAQAFGVRPELVRRAAMLEGDLARIAAVARSAGEAGLGAFRLEPFRPIGPMLAQTAAGANEALSALGTAILEQKLDGARIQVHKAHDRVEIYTRSLHRVTARAPEIVEAVARLPPRSLILDGEALSLRSDGRPQPFQMTMRRFGRKLENERVRADLPLSPFFFDLLHVDGEDLIDRPASERRERLLGVLPSSLSIPSLVTEELDAAERFLAGALAAGHEGLLAKDPAAPYEAGRRGAGWLKVKPSHTLDLVVLAVEWGSGRRQGFLSNLHLGARDPETGGFVMLGKTFKGMTDEMLAWQTQRLSALELGREGHVVHVRPELVVEIAFDGVQASQQYPGGVALRFARVRRYRTEKSAAEADTIASVHALAARARNQSPE